MDTSVGDGMTMTSGGGEKTCWGSIAAMAFF